MAYIGEWTWCPDGEKRRVVVEHRPTGIFRYRATVEIGFARYSAQFVSYDYRLTEAAARSAAERRLSRLISKQLLDEARSERARSWR